jgi:hypothetical protein
MSHQVLERNKLCRRCVGRFQNHRRRQASIEGFFPATDAQTPAVPRLEAGKSYLRVRRNEIIATGDRKLQKLGGHDRTDCMKTEISWSCATEAITIEAGRWIRAATLQISAKNIGWHRLTVREIWLRGS